MDDADVQARLDAMHSAYEAFFPELKALSSTTAPIATPVSGEGSIDYLDTSIFSPAQQLKMDP